MENEVKPKKLNKVSKIVGIISTAFLVLCVGILLYSTISYAKTGLVNFFGYSFHVIQSPSMEPDIKVGDVVIVKRVPFDQIDVGDDILFKCEDTTSAVYGKYIVHRVIEKTDTEGVYKTKGVNNPGPDKVPSKAEGKAVKVSSSLGGLLSFMTNGRNIILVVAIAGFVIFVVMQLCSVIANAAKVKAERDKENLNADVELKEKIKKELEQELEQEKQNNSKNNENLDKNSEKVDKNQQTEDKKEIEEVKEETKPETAEKKTKNKRTRSDGV